MKRLSVIFMMIRQRKGLIIFGLVAILLPLAGCVSPPSPYPPSDLESIPLSSESISLTWQDNAFTEEGFYVYRRSTGGYNRIAALEADATSYDDLGLDAGITYWYKITAYNTGGESNPCKEESATTEEEAQAFFNLSTPENTMRSFVEATWLGDSEKAEQCLSDTIPDSMKTLSVALVRIAFEQVMEEDPTLREIFQSPEFAKIFSTLVLYEKEQIRSDAFYVWMVSPGGMGGKEDSLEVVRENGKWKIALIPDMEDFGDLLKEEERAYEDWESDFYGERLTVSIPPEEAFGLYLVEGEVSIIRYEQEGKEKVDSSIFSYAYFDPDWTNVLSVSIANDGRFPIELDYDNDRYYIGSYGGNVYQCEIDLDLGYGKVINPGDLVIIDLIFPQYVSDTDIKDIIIELAKGDIIIGLQKMPR